MEPNNDQRKVPRFLLLLLSIAALLILLLTIAQAYFSWQNWSNLNHVSGAWLTLATDVNNGIFYRPLYSDITGYGGTRFFPLQFLLHAGIIHLIGNPIKAGFILNIGSALCLVAGFFILLKKINLNPYPAIICCILVFANISFQESLTDIRGDILPVALNIWGVVFCLCALEKKPGVIIIAAFCFVLAFAAKVTAVYGLFAAVCWFYFSGERLMGLRLLSYSVLGISILLILIQIVSDGRFFEIMRWCSPGGANIETILKSPLRIAKRLLLKEMNYALACFVAAGTILFFSLFFRNLFVILSIIFLSSSFLMTLFIFGSPGTESNHFIDLHVALVLLIASGFVSPSKVALQTQYGILALLSMIVIVPIFQKTWDSMESNHKTNINMTVAFIEQLRTEEKPLLSEDPILPLVAEKDIWLQDAFMFRLIKEKKERDDRFGYPMHERIRQKRFGAVVLFADLTNKNWYQKTHFGKDTIKLLADYYHFEKKIGGYRIFLPND